MWNENIFRVNSKNIIKLIEKIMKKKLYLTHKNVRLKCNYIYMYI